MLYIGCHLASSKGYKAMGMQAVDINANTFAFFTRNPRGGSAKALNMSDVEAFLTICQEHSFGKLVAHAPYTMNACAADENIRRFALLSRQRWIGAFRQYCQARVSGTAPRQT